MPRKKAKRREVKKEKERSESTISRRSVLKIGAAAGAVTVLAPNMITTRKALGFQQSVPKPLNQCLVAPNNRSPAHVPFVDELPIPFPAIDHPLNPQPTETANTGALEWPRAPHQRFAQFTPAHVTTELEARPGTHRFHSGYGETYIWGFNGVYPGPTILGRYGKSNIVRFRNSLPAVNDNTFGHPEITIHLHNGHHGSESDGFAGDFFPTGRWKDNLYPNVYAGIDAFGGNPGGDGVGDPREKMGTFWYHDHRAEKTLQNNVLGLNGMYIVYDSTDPGHEHASAGSLRLPGYYGVTDIPLILTEKRFCPLDAQGRNEMVNAAGGDKWIVNGAIQPRMTVRNRKYRFRILSTGPTTAQWDLRLFGPTGNIETMTVIATDANFLEHPVPVDASSANRLNSNSIVGETIIVEGAVRVNVAERYDVIIDFSNYNPGDKLYLTDARIMSVNNNPPTQPLNIPPPGFLTNIDIGNVIMRFDVVNRETWFPQDTPDIPETLCTYPPIPDPVDATFQWNFDRDPAGTLPARLFRINQRVFDANVPQHCVIKGTSEEWLINNNTPNADGPTNWKHPVHIHFEEFRILKRFAIVGGVFREVDVTPLSRGRKDVTAVEPGEAALIRMNFRDYIGKYLIHCHNMGHEDAFMMVAWHIVPDAAAKAVCDDLIVQANKEFEAKLRGEEV